MSTFIFNWIFFILAGNEAMNESCPWASGKPMYNVVNTLAPSFLIESSSFL